MSDIEAALGLNEEVFWVDRGEQIRVVAYFPGAAIVEPDEVNFSFTHPGSERPYADDGFGQPKSKLVRLDAGTYRYVISTADFDPGVGDWVISAEWRDPLPQGHDRELKRGKYGVKSSPKQLP